ncbi:MAG: hypothetical protein H0U98_12635 [Alphaproteobacteria bacterium]|nr:hypothetical protein [Alphaproteobacteria bacterium]
MQFGSRLEMLWAAWFAPKGIKRISERYAQYIVGGIALEWAAIETTLDLMALVAYAGGGTKLSANLPMSLSRKIKFLRLAFRKLPELEKCETEASVFFDRIEKLSDEALGDPCVRLAPYRQYRYGNPGRESKAA